jgi:hypothetical protein
MPTGRNTSGVAHERQRRVACLSPSVVALALKLNAKPVTAEPRPAEFDVDTSKADCNPHQASLNAGSVIGEGLSPQERLG